MCLMWQKIDSTLGGFVQGTFSSSVRMGHHQTTPEAMKKEIAVIHSSSSLVFIQISLFICAEALISVRAI